MPPTITATVGATGGVVVLNILLSAGLDQNSANITIQRYTGSLSNPPTTILNNSLYTPVFIDDGEALPAYLDFNTQYWYSITDSVGTATIGPISPGAQLVIFSSYLDKLLFRLFSAGVSALAVPQGFNKIRVLESLPLTMGSEATLFPFVVMNLDLEQQEYTQIGEDVDASETNIDVIPLIVFRRYSVCILSHNAKERDFYKDACMGVLYTAMRSVLADIGSDLTYSFQATNSQVSDDQKAPGFYECTIMVNLSGMFNLSVHTNYPLIEFIAPVITSTTATISGVTTIFSV